MERRRKVVILGAVLNAQGELLVTQRADPKVPEAHLLWDLPGGTVEFGEDPRETVRRELLEETGLQVLPNELFPELASRVWDHDDYKFHALVLCFQCTHTGGELQNNDPKIAEIRWVPVSALLKMKFLPTTQHFIDYIIKQWTKTSTPLEAKTTRTKKNENISTKYSKCTRSS